MTVLPRQRANQLCIDFFTTRSRVERDVSRDSWEKQLYTVLDVLPGVTGRGLHTPLLHTIQFEHLYYRRGGAELGCSWEGTS